MIGEHRLKLALPIRTENHSIRTIKDTQLAKKIARTVELVGGEKFEEFEPALYVIQHLGAGWWPSEPDAITYKPAAIHREQVVYTLLDTVFLELENEGLDVFNEKDAVLIKLRHFGRLQFVRP
jgi:hypothetical protein